MPVPEGHCEVPRGCPWPSATVKFYKFYFILFFTLYLVYSFLEIFFLFKFFYCISLSLFHLFPFLFYSFCVFTFFLVYVWFMFLYFYVFIYLFIYLFRLYFLFQKDYSFFNMFYNENNFLKKLYFCLIRCKSPPRTATGSAIENAAPRFCRWIKMHNCHIKQTDAQTHAKTHVVNLYIRCVKKE